MLYQALFFIMAVWHFVIGLLSRTWDLLLAGFALWLFWSAAHRREAPPNARRGRVLLAGSILLFLYLPPFGERLERPHLAAYFDPEILHAEPVFVRAPGAVYVQIRLKAPVPPWFAATYLNTLERRGIEIDGHGTSPFGPMPHQTGWTIRGVREIATEPYTVEHFTSYVTGVGRPASLRWPWLYLRLGPGFFESFRRSVVLPKRDAQPVHLDSWRYPGGVVTLRSAHPASMSVRLLAPARRAQIVDYYKGLLEERYRLIEETPYRVGFERRSQTDLGPLRVALEFDESIWYCSCEAPSIYSTEVAERRRREPPLATWQRRSQQSVLLPHLPLLTQYELNLSYAGDATSSRYAFIHTFQPGLVKRLDAIALRRGLPWGELDDDQSRRLWLAAAEVGVYPEGGFESAVEDGFKEPVATLVERWGRAPELPQGLRLVIVPPEREVRDAAALRRFAMEGGIVAFFRQTRATGYLGVPRPDDARLTIRGSGDSKSRYKAAARVERFHPILSSVPAPVFSILIDGVIQELPKESLVLLRSVRDGDAPALVLYRVGKGWVAVGPLFAFNESEYGPQENTGGLEIVRDMITWAKDPERPIAVVSPGEPIRLSIEVVSRSKQPTRIVRLRTWSPSRDALLDEREAQLSLGPGARASVAYGWTVPKDAPLGIHHVDFELLDGSKQVVQPEAETASGRFAVAALGVR